MGRIESLTAWSLGRGPFEDEVIQTTGERSTESSGQQYNNRGNPVNLETRRREREQIRAANEVMQVTGVVEDSHALKKLETTFKNKKIEDTFTGLRLMEIGRAVLVGGVWGVIGLRRRILLYKPYSEMSFLSILRIEKSIQTVPSMVWSGFPTVVAYHISDYVDFVAEAFLDSYWDDEDANEIFTPRQLWIKRATQKMLDAGFCYITLHFRMFAILQQLNLIPGRRLLPSLLSFIPFSSASPLQLPPFSGISSGQWVLSLIRTAIPMLSILLHGRVKYYVAKLLYRPIYKTLPRPTGESMFSGLDVYVPELEYDAPDRTWSRTGEDEETLRALEGRSAPGDDAEYTDPAARRDRLLSISIERQDAPSDGEEEPHHAPLISFDVEATDAPPDLQSGWSAELRSANEVKASKNIQYRVTGLTMLPVILATEGLREVAASVLVLPLEALMVRIIARAYRTSGGVGLSDLYEIFSTTDIIPSPNNIFGAFALQVAVTGVVWAGFTLCVQSWITRRDWNPDTPSVGQLLESN